MAELLQKTNRIELNVLYILDTNNYQTSIEKSKEIGRIKQELKASNIKQELKKSNNNVINKNWSNPLKFHESERI